MNAKNKAEQIFNRFYTLFIETNSEISEEITISILSKECSIITVNEVIADASKKNSHIDRNQLSDYDYWWEVKKELQKM